MREIIQCLFCASVGFMTASLLSAAKNHPSNEASISDPPQNDRISEVPVSPNLSEIPKGT